MLWRFIICLQFMYSSGRITDEVHAQINHNFMGQFCYKRLAEEAYDTYSLYNGNKDAL
jgi:hypothetical protein